MRKKRQAKTIFPASFKILPPVLKSGRTALFLLFFFLCSCSKTVCQIHPKIECQVHDRFLTSLPSPFPPLNILEEKEDWGKELLISRQFFQDLDLYRAISTLKRAEILLPPSFNARKKEVSYDILYCYYLGKQYQEVVDTFEKGPLRQCDASFPAFRELLIMLLDSYRILKKEEEKEQILQQIYLHFPDLSEKLLTSSALLSGDLDFIKKKPELNPLVSLYERGKKSAQKAEVLNLLLPGSGYWYLGLKRTAITAFLMNGLFIAATYEFFHHGHIAAGIITASFEAGWYFGGIYGAAEETKFYNERVFEKTATPFMKQEKLFPLLMLRYGF